MWREERGGLEANIKDWLIAARPFPRDVAASEGGINKP